MDIKVNQRVLAFAVYQGKPMWLPGVVREIFAEAGHAGVIVRRDYRGLIDGNEYMVAPTYFLFDNVTEADEFVRAADRGLSSFTTSHDSSEEAWAPAMLSWSDPEPASDPTEQASDDTAQDSASASTQQASLQA